MTVVEDILAYMNQKYMNSPNLLNATLGDIKERKVPKSYQQAADNISAIITMGRLLNNVGILKNRELTQLAMLESRCILAGTRKKLYNQKQIENMAKEEEGQPRASTPILEGTIQEPPPPPILDGSMVLAQISETLARAQSGRDAGRR